MALVLPTLDQADQEGDELLGRALPTEDQELPFVAIAAKAISRIARATSDRRPRAFRRGVVDSENRVLYDRLDRMLILLILAKAEEVSGKQQVQNAADAVGPQGPLLDCAREKAAAAIGQPPRLGDYLPAIIADPDRNGIEDRQR